MQWLTAGAGIVHCEMFPLLERDRPNPCELFQIWLNLPASDNMVDPYFTMLWSEDLPHHVVTDGAGRTTDITIIAGELAGLRPPPPPPDSWAARRRRRRDLARGVRGRRGVRASRMRLGPNRPHAVRVRR